MLAAYILFALAQAAVENGPAAVIPEMMASGDYEDGRHAGQILAATNVYIGCADLIATDAYTNDILEDQLWKIAKVECRPERDIASRAFARQLRGKPDPSAELERRLGDVDVRFSERVGEIFRWKRMRKGVPDDWGDEHHPSGSKPPR